jgi:hypothetical protein
LPKHHPQAANQYFFACEVQHKSNHLADWAPSHHSRHSMHVRTNSKGSVGSKSSTDTSTNAKDNRRQSMSRAALLNAHTAIMETGRSRPLSVVRESDDSPRSAQSTDVSTPGSGDINNSLTQMFGDEMVSGDSNAVKFLLFMHMFLIE